MGVGHIIGDCISARNTYLPMLPQGGRAPVGKHRETIAELARQALSAADPADAAHETAEYLTTTSDDVKLVSGRLAYFRRELKKGGAPPFVISMAKRRDITMQANEERMRAFYSPGSRAYKGIRPSDFYAFETIKARLDAADLKQTPTRQDVLDVMVAVSARPCELKTLAITPDGVTGFAKSRARSAAPRPFASFLPTARATELLIWVQRGIGRRCCRTQGLWGRSRIVQR